MLILHTASLYAPLTSGIPEVVGQLSERLARRGHELHVATSAVDGSPSTEVRNGVTVHRFRVSGNAVTGIKGDAEQYLGFVRSRQWDVLSSHCAQTWTTDLLLEEALDFPAVFVAHGLSSYRNPAYRDYFGTLAAWLRNGRAMVSIAGVGIEDSDFIRDHELPPSTVIHNGVSTEEWVTPELGVRRKWGIGTRPWLVNVSTHCPPKAHHRLFELMKTMRATDPSALLTQIGCTYPAARWNLGSFGVKGGCYYACQLKSAFSQGLSMKLDIPRAETVSAIKEADLMVLTSAWEASPLVILESMAAGTPFVSFDVGNVREHAGGRVVHSVREMQSAVHELLADKDLRIELGAQGKACVAERHDWERMVDSYERLYRELTLNHTSSLVC